MAGLPGVLRAQRSSLRERVPSLSELLGDPSLSLMPSVGWNRPGPRSSLDARFFWPGRTEQAVRVQLGVELGGTRSAPGWFTRTATDLRLVFRGQRVTPWLEGAFGVGNGAGPRQMPRAGAGLSLGWLELAVRYSELHGVPTRHDTIPMQTPKLTRWRFTDTEMTSTWRRGAYELAATAGQRFGEFSGQRQWGYATLTVPVHPRVGISLAGGWRPDQPERLQRSGRFALLAVRVDATPRRPESAFPAKSDELTLCFEPLRRGYRLRLTAQSARTVELKGDLSDWEVRPFQRVAPGLWELDVDVAAGIYRINIRINEQDWIVPRGLVAAPDGFGGLAGVLNLQ
jgi:hypothetical protein